ncbi:MAG: hypothetical protein O8C64_16240 [Candidatus Methanoperedens sp.]|nr:hypothetical protein [Candidatus Methanoperedens sp.]
MRDLDLKVKCLISALVFLLLAGGAGATPVEQWNKTFGGTNWDFANSSVQQTSDGGYITAGQTNSYGAGSGDAWLIKTDASGNEQWNKTFGGINWDYATSVQQTSDGGYILAGTTNSYGAGSGDAWLIKTDASGNEQWNRTFGGTGWDSAYSVQQTSDGGYILAGTTNSYGAGSYVWLIKTDTNGNELWNRTFGGTGWDTAYSVQQTSDGGYILAAGTRNSYGTGSYVWLIKTDTNGNGLWNKTFGGTSWDTAYSVRQTSDGGYVLAGNINSYGAGNGDVWLIKTDSSGNEQWDRTFGGTSWDTAYSVQQTSDDGYILAGTTYSYGAGNGDTWLIKTGANGNEQWNMTFGGANWEWFASVQQTSDGGYILASTTSSYGAGSGDAWLIKLSGNVAYNSVGYSATVATGQNTYVQSTNGTFGLLLKGQSKTTQCNQLRFRNPRCPYAPQQPWH